MQKGLYPTREDIVKGLQVWRYCPECFSGADVLANDPAPFSPGAGVVAASSLAAERDAAAGEREASSQLRVLLQQAQTLAGAIPANVSQEERASQAEIVSSPSESHSFWDRLLGRS